MATDTDPQNEGAHRNVQTPHVTISETAAPEMVEQEKDAATSPFAAPEEPAFAPFEEDAASSPHSSAAPYMTSNEGLAEDSVKYIKDHNIGQLMEYLLRSILRDKPADPRRHVHEMTEAPLPPQIALAGPPAGGKGTQARHICNYYRRLTGKKPVHVSSGDLLRDEVARGTYFGKIAEACMHKGEMVPDSLIISVIRNRVIQEDAVMNGWLLDGFPRNRSQAVALDAVNLCPRLFIVLDVPDEVLYERVEGRRTDPVTGNIYHLRFNPPPEDDPELLSRLQQRDDDSREVLGPRLDNYHTMVDGLLDYYGSIMYRIDANRTEEEITQDIIANIRQHDVA